MDTTHTDEALDCVTLVYRVPRQPSSPRIAIWRKLRALGVAQLGDGEVSLSLSEPGAQRWRGRRPSRSGAAVALPMIGDRA